MLSLAIVLIPWLAAEVTIDTRTLFENTVKRWDVKMRDKRDLGERWERFREAKRSVERTTSGVMLESLNFFALRNNEEHAELKRRYHQAPNRTFWEERPEVPLQKRYVNDHWNPEDHPTYEYWEKTIGFPPARDQKSCGACWSFPAVASLEAVYKKLTGESVLFSEQYFVDCTFPGSSGCNGGSAKSAYEVTRERQFLVTADEYPFTGNYQGSCPYEEQIETGEGNSMSKIWLQDYMPLSTNEQSMLKGLGASPVAFTSLVSDDLLDYSGGIFEDVNCARDVYPHAQLLVGYTETVLRVRASYGERFGDGGYVNYKRDSQYLGDCQFYSDAYAILATERREYEFEFCHDKTLVTRDECKESCLAMDSGTKTGWEFGQHCHAKAKQRAHEYGE